MQSIKSSDKETQIKFYLKWFDKFSFLARYYDSLVEYDDSGTYIIKANKCYDLSHKMFTKYFALLTHLP